MAIKSLIIFACAVLAAGALWYLFMHQNNRTITIGGVSVAVDVADTEVLRELGLSGRSDLQSGKGMLFVFESDGLWGIWMKDMQFPIDIVWAGADGKVITVADNVAPETYPKVFSPSAPARYVVELPAGYAAAHSIAEGVKMMVQ